MRWMGGIPVDRSKPGNVVDQVLSEIENADRIVLAISPEGTRKKVKHWKTGFYRIAQGAEMTIVPIVLDYGMKTIRFLPPFMPTGEQESDISHLQGLFMAASARHPGKY